MPSIFARATVKRVTPGALMNEEDVKVHLVMPRLQECGFTQEELHLEATFTLRAGRYTLNVGGKGAPRAHHVRADILVLRAGKPLMIVEVKADHVDLSADDDRDQAVSYARLHDPMCPVAALTNGKRWRFFDTVSKKEISADDVKASTALTITLEDELRREALIQFVGYSKENLAAFCAEQVRTAVAPYLAGLDGTLPLFIPSLYVLPGAMRDAWAKFVEGSQRGLLVSGGNGSGKSAWMVHASTSLTGQGRPCLFYRAHLLSDGFIARLASDLAWALSPNLSSDAAGRRFANTLRGAQLVVFIDSADEASEELTRAALNELVERFPANVRFVVACKSTRVAPLGRDPDGLDAAWFQSLGD